MKFYTQKHIKLGHTRGRNYGKYPFLVWNNLLPLASNVCLKIDYQKEPMIKRLVKLLAPRFKGYLI